MFQYVFLRNIEQCIGLYRLSVVLAKYENVCFDLVR
jgi:hypothetical protein